MTLRNSLETNKQVHVRMAQWCEGRRQKWWVGTVAASQKKNNGERKRVLQWHRLLGIRLGVSVATGGQSKAKQDAFEEVA
jgi:hypothetical protein